MQSDQTSNRQVQHPNLQYTTARFPENNSYQAQQDSRCESTHNFTVTVRIKPKLTQQENIKIILNKNSKEMSIQSSKNMRSAYYGSKYKKFKMDHIFDDKTSNFQIFSQIVKDKLALLKNNCNISLMAYGATNSGKTYTIFGQTEQQNLLQNQPKSQGLAHIAGRYLMQNLFSSGYKFYFSYLQIYNENIQDLLSSHNKKHYLNLFQDHNGKVNIPDLTRIEVESYLHLSELIEKGNSARVESSNNINSFSSRSHAILQLDIFSIQQSENTITEVPVDVNFMIIDLAGSEKSTPYFQQSQQITLKEGSNINRSLLSLGNCIKSLANGVQHIPYRDSKLTRLLKDNLSGYCHNIMIACISQSLNQYEESINTLQYASKACKIEVIAKLGANNRSKHLNINCQHCKMEMDFGYVCKVLKQHAYDVIDNMNKTAHQARKYDDDQSNIIKSDDEELFKKCIRKIQKIKYNKEQIHRVLEYLKKMDTENPKSLELPSKKMQEQTKDQPHKLSLKIKKNTSNSSKEYCKTSKDHERSNKELKHIRISLNLNEEKKTIRTLSDKIGSKKHYEDRTMITSKSKDNLNITAIDKIPSHKFSSINSHGQDSLSHIYSNDNSAPYMLDFDLNQLYIPREDTNTQKYFENIRQIKYHSKYEPIQKLESNENDINAINSSSRQEKKLYLEIDSVQTEPLISVQNRIIKRMKPDIAQPEPQLLKQRLNLPLSQFSVRSRLKIVPKLR